MDSATAWAIGWGIFGGVLLVGSILYIVHFINNKKKKKDQELIEKYDIKTEEVKINEDK